MYVSTLRWCFYLEMFGIGKYVVLVSTMAAILLTVTKQAPTVQSSWTNQKMVTIKIGILDEIFQLRNILT